MIPRARCVARLTGAGGFDTSPIPSRCKPVAISVLSLFLNVPLKKPSKINVPCPVKRKIFSYTAWAEKPDRKNITACVAAKPAIAAPQAVKILLLVLLLNQQLQLSRVKFLL